MKRFVAYQVFIWAAGILLCGEARSQQGNISQVADDARAIRRVTEVAGRRDLPRDILRTIVKEDIDILRGKQPDSTYQFAEYGKEDAGRITEDYTVAAGEKLTPLKVRGDFVYELLVESPARRYLVRKNQRVFVERVEVDLSPIGSSPSRLETIPVDAWLDRGQTRRIGLPEIARAARVTVYARTEKEAGPASLQLSLVKARIIDDPNSPYARAVETAKLLEESLNKEDRSRVITTAGMLGADPALKAGNSRGSERLEMPVEVPAKRTEQREIIPGDPFYEDLQEIEDLLTGSDEERREGLDRLHQVIRRMRPSR